MTTIAQVYKLVKSGVPLEVAAPEGADLQLWQSLIDNYNPDAPKKSRRATSRQRARQNKRTNYASQVIARNTATLELVKRVNDKYYADIESEEIPFQGEPVHTKSIRPEDEYGLEAKF